MIERTTIDGKYATVAYLKGDMVPCGPDEAEFVKVLFDDGGATFGQRVRDGDPTRRVWSMADLDIDAALGELSAAKVNGRIAQPDGVLRKFDEKREARIRKNMELMAHYAESGPTFDPDGNYLCGTCYYRQVMDWATLPACYTVSGKISMETGSCAQYVIGNPDSEWNPLPVAERYTQIEAMYGERPEAKGFGCAPRCGWGEPAREKDSEGRTTWCTFFGTRVMDKACCDREGGPDLKEAPGE